MLLGNIVSIALLLALGYFAVLCTMEIVRAVVIRVNMSQREDRLNTLMRVARRYSIF